MSDGKLYKTSVIKQGTGKRIFLAFAGRRHRSSEADQLPPKSDMTQELIGILLLIAVVCMIAMTLWHFFSRLTK